MTDSTSILLPFGTVIDLLMRLSKRRTMSSYLGGESSVRRKSRRGLWYFD